MQSRHCQRWPDKVGAEYTNRKQSWELILLYSRYYISENK